MSGLLQTGGPAAGSTGQTGLGGEGGIGGGGIDSTLFLGSPAVLPAGTATAKAVDISDARQGALAYIDLDGTNVLYAFGLRDAEGAINPLQAVILLNSETGKAWQIILDSDGLPDELIDGDVTVSVLWNDDGTFVLYRGDDRVEGSLSPDALPLLESFQAGGAARVRPASKEMSAGDIAAGICAPLGMVAGVVLGTYTSPIWAGLTIAGATAAGITGAYNAAYGATGTPPPPDLQQAMNVVDAVGTLTSVADLGNGVITNLARKPAEDVEVLEKLSILNNIQGLAGPVAQGVRATMGTQTRGSVTIYPEGDTFVIWVSPPRKDVQLMTYVESSVQADNQGVITDSLGRGLRSLRPVPRGETVRMLIWGFTPEFEVPQWFTFQF